MVGRRPNPQRADVIERHSHVDRDPQAADARVDRQASASRWREELDLGIERPTPEPTPRAAMHRNVDTALWQDRRESFGNGCHSTVECIEAGDRWLAFSALSVCKSERPLTLQAETPRLLVRIPTKTNRPQSLHLCGDTPDRSGDACAVPKQILPIDGLDQERGRHVDFPKDHGVVLGERIGLVGQKDHARTSFDNFFQPNPRIPRIARIHLFSAPRPGFSEIRGQGVKPLAFARRRCPRHRSPERRSRTHLRRRSSKGLSKWEQTREPPCLGFRDVHPARRCGSSSPGRSDPHLRRVEERGTRGIRGTRPRCTESSRAPTSPQP